MSESSRVLSSQSSQLPTRVRYRVVGVAILLAMVTYLDRVCIGKLAPEISRDLHLDKVQMGYVFSAFQLSYALFEIPTAWWADRRGTRLVLTRIVVWWSFFTMLTAATFNYASMLVTRFLFGVGEAGAWPCVARTFSRWIPARERGTAKGIFFSGAYLAGGITPPLVEFLLRNDFHWRWIFVCFGMTGFIWAAVWYWWFRDEPEQHPAVNAAELDLIVVGRPDQAAHETNWAFWRLLLCRRNMILICLMYIPNSVTFYFCITWFPTYLEERHHFKAAMLGFLSGLPLILSVLSQFLGGFFSDWINSRYGLRIGRRLPGIVGYLIAAFAILFAVGSDSPQISAVLIAVATASCMFTTASAWGTCVDIGQQHSAVVGATMNSAGAFGSMIGPLVVAYSVQKFNNWNVPLYLLSGMFILGAICWLFIDPLKPIFDPEPVDHSPQKVAS